MTKRVWKPGSMYKVYKTHYTDGSYYIGKWSDKSKIPYDKYYGSNNAAGKIISHKETLGVFKKATDAAVLEALLQLKFRNDENCLNKMVHIRTQLNFISDKLPDFDITFKDNKFNLEEEEVLNDDYFEQLNKNNN